MNLNKYASSPEVSNTTLYTLTYKTRFERATCSTAPAQARYLWGLTILTLQFTWTYELQSYMNEMWERLKQDLATTGYLAQVDGQTELVTENDASKYPALVLHGDHVHRVQSWLIQHGYATPEQVSVCSTSSAASTSPQKAPVDGSPTWRDNTTLTAILQVGLQRCEPSQPAIGVLSVEVENLKHIPSAAEIRRDMTCTTGLSV